MLKDKLTTYERRENIKVFLIKERATITSYLAALFGVSRETIMRDITFISYRIPILTKMGKYGGIFLDSDFENHKEYLTTEEFNLLVSLLNDVNRKIDKLRLLNIINKFSLPNDKCGIDVNCV